MNLDFPDRVVVTRETFAENIDLVISKAVSIPDELEEGELSENDIPEEVPSRLVTRPTLLSDIKRSLEGVKKRNPWGGVAASWTSEVVRRGSQSLDSEYVEQEVGMKRISVKERLGWKSRDESGLNFIERREEAMKWKEKMKRPRMEMVADMEERKIASKNRLFGTNFAKRELNVDKSLYMNSWEQKVVYENGNARTRELELDDMAIVRSVSNDVEKTINRADQVGRDLTLSKRFVGNNERRPKFRGKLERTVDFGVFIDKGAGDKKEYGAKVGENKMVSALRKESVDSLENDNGSNLDDDAGILIQVIQSDTQSSDEESTKIRQAVAKIEEAKKREELRRLNIKSGNFANNLDNDIKRKSLKKRKELVKEDSEEEVNERKMKQRLMERRVKDKIAALKAANKKLLMEKTRQKKIREKIGVKKLSKDCRSHGSSRKRRRDETESSDTVSDSSSSSSSDISDNDSCSDSSEIKDKKRNVKKRGVGHQNMKLKLLKPRHVSGKYGKYDRATSTPKKETSTVQKPKVQSEENEGKVSDLKSKLKDYLRKAKGKKST